MTFSFDSIVVTGSAAISAAGTGIEPLLQLLASGGTVRTPVPDDIPHAPGQFWAKATHFKATDFMPPLKARKLDRCSQFAVAATGLALKDAGIVPAEMEPERIGIALGCGFGGLANSAEFLCGFFASGSEGLSPMLFPNTVANAAASNASIEHGLKGPNVTLVQRFCSAESALLMACRFIEEGRADVMVVGGADDLMPLMASGFAAMGQHRRYASLFGEGAGILVLERADRAQQRGARIRGRLQSVATIGMLVPGREQEGIELLLGPGGSAGLVSLSGTACDLTPLRQVVDTCPVLDIGFAVGRSLAMGATAMAALLAKLEQGTVGLHLAASPEGPCFAIRFTGGSPV